MNYADLKLFDTVNGPGVRVSLFVSGCTVNCPGCFNTEARNFRFGKVFDEEVIEKIVSTVDSKHYEGISILGGDPCEVKNIDSVVTLCRRLRERAPDKSIWIWTGRTIEELQAKEGKAFAELLSLADVIVDGRFVQELADAKLKYRGSSNQRILYRKNGDF